MNKNEYIYSYTIQKEKNTMKSKRSLPNHTREFSSENKKEMKIFKKIIDITVLWYRTFSTSSTS